MSQNLQSVLEAARQLPPEQRRRLAAQLLEEVEKNEPRAPELARDTGVPDLANQSAHRDGGDEQIRQRRLEWLKLHREEFAGQYVALDGEVLVGHGATIREAHQQAKEKGVENPFLVRLTSESEVLFAGW